MCTLDGALHTLEILILLHKIWAQRPLPSQTGAVYSLEKGHFLPFRARSAVDSGCFTSEGQYQDFGLLTLVIPRFVYSLDSQASDWKRQLYFIVFPFFCSLFEIKLWPLSSSLTNAPKSRRGARESLQVRQQTASKRADFWPEEEEANTVQFPWPCL